MIARELALRASTIAPLGAPLGALVSVARERERPPGAHLYRQGEVSDRIFMIVEGEVVMHGAGPPWRATPGTSLGAMDLFIGRPYARTARTVTRVRTLELEATDFVEFLRDNFDTAQRLIGQFAAAITRRVLTATSPHALVEGPARAGRVASHTSAPGTLSLMDRLALLRQVPAFTTGSIQALGTLAQAAQQLRVAPGTVVAAGGAATDLVSILVRGRVALRHPALDRELDNAWIDLVAHTEELVGGPRALTAVASTEVELLQLHREELLDRLEDHFELVRSLLRYLALEQERINDDLATRGEPL